jgi:hypothetical protein
MRHALVLVLFAFPLSALAGRNGPIICDPPPVSAQACPSESSQIAYLDPSLFAKSNGELEDYCNRTPSEIEARPSWIGLCESNLESPHVQLLCREDEAEHYIKCLASPAQSDADIKWAVDESVVVSDAETDLNARNTSFACGTAGLGAVTLQITKVSGATAIVTADVLCTGSYEMPILEEPCPDCIAIDPPPYDPVDVK